MILREATIADVPFVMQTERLPGYELTVGRWTEEQHATEMMRAGSRYLIAVQRNEDVAFAILQTLEDLNGNVYLKRLAVTRQGEGIGGRALSAVQDWVFARPLSHRFHLHYSVANTRGARLYLSAGFRREGVQRETYKLPDGSRVDGVEVSILRREWEQMRRV